MWGIDRLGSGQLSAVRRRLRGSRVGVLTHAAAVDRHGNHLIKVLEQLGVQVHLVLTPEHGFDGVFQAEECVTGGIESLHWPRPARAQDAPPSSPARAAAGLSGSENPTPDVVFGDDDDARDPAELGHEHQQELAQLDGLGDAPESERDADEGTHEDDSPVTPEAPSSVFDESMTVEAPQGVAPNEPADQLFAAAPTPRGPAPEPVIARVVSLYGANKASLSPAESDFDDIDVLVIDLVDIGTRCYTYVWTALMCARLADKKGVHTLVLDRPNPLSGDPKTLEGAPQEPAFLSFVGLEPLPLRHAMTLGEVLVHFFAQAGRPLGTEGSLSVATVQGWERFRSADAWRLPFNPPSPNMPSVAAALAYPGGCLLEGTNLSEGRGTSLPFQLVGAPFLDAESLADELRKAELPGVTIRPAAFRPMFDKHQGSVCRGVLLQVTAPEQFRPVATYLTLIALARQQAPESFQFIERVYEFENERLAFDLLLGTSAVRQALQAGADTAQAVSLGTPVEARWAETILHAEALTHDAARA